MYLHDVEVGGMQRDFEELVERVENVLERNIAEKNKRDLMQYGSIMGLAHIGGLKGKPAKVGGTFDGSKCCFQWNKVKLNVCIAEIYGP